MPVPAGTLGGTDQLADAPALNALPGLGDVSATVADQLLQMATGIVQGTVLQRLVEIANDTATLLGTAEAWLHLPERPVIAVTTVTLDGAEVTDFTPSASRLWRANGWATDPCAPSTVVVNYSHGYEPDDYRLGFARSVVLMLAGGAATGTPGVTSESIDDYQVVYEKMAARMEAAEALQKSLRRAYGRRAGLVRV